MEKRAAKRRIVLVPYPFQGHITPMMQLGRALNLKGFSITVVQARFNRVNSTHDFPGFQFVNLSESLSNSEVERLELTEFMMKLNKTSKTSFKECIAQLLLQQGDDDIACIIYDEFMYSCVAAAKEYKLPCVTFTTGSATHKACHFFLSKLNVNKFLMDMEDLEMQDKKVEALMHPITYKDLPTSGFGPLEPFWELWRVVNKRTGDAIILNTVSCLESASLSWLQQKIGIPVYPLGPLHIAAPRVESSLLEDDRSCIEWLNKQEARSVIYISLGSLFEMEWNEVLEMAWGLIVSKQPFLWVIRQGSASLPEKMSEMILERGYIVKWAPQKEVLAHPAVGGFWSHSGWNSILESILEGIPMICKPFQGEQKLNGMYVERVWGIGIQVEGEVERGKVERVVKRLVVDEEGAKMRERGLVLKEKLKSSVTCGGSSYSALDDFVNYLKTK